ncbi:MAG: STAS domain-containing protein [Methyloprofundus sp.]|nr:STAS domain-containing protein [Methyloprofundus sp.]
MSLQTKLEKNRLTIYLPQVFDINLYEAFNDSYKAFESQLEEVILDFSDTVRIDSAALGLMLLLRQKTHLEQSALKIVNANSEKVKKSLDIAQFGKLFEIV